MINGNVRAFLKNVILNVEVPVGLRIEALALYSGEGEEIAVWIGEDRYMVRRSVLMDNDRKRGKIYLIKDLRAALNIGLKEAKDIADRLEADGLYHYPEA